MYTHQVMKTIVANSDCVIFQTAGELKSVHLGCFPLPAYSPKGVQTSTELVNFISSQECEYTPSTVAKKSSWQVVQEVDPSVRNSMKSCTFQFQSLLEFTQQQVQQLNETLPILYRSSSPDLIFGDSVVLKYSTGCHFAKHTDTVRNNKHLLTVLFFPPLVDYEGGELVLYTESGVVTVDKSMYDQNSWLIVAFRTGVPHEVKTVTLGVRYVIKSSLVKKTLEHVTESILASQKLTLHAIEKSVDEFVTEIQQWDSDNSESDDDNSDSDTDSEDDEIWSAKTGLRQAKEKLKQAEIAVLKRRIMKSIQKSLQNVVSLSPESALGSMMLKGRPSRGLYILKRFYPAGTKEDLLPAHRDFYESLEKNYGFVTLVTLQLENSIHVDKPGQIRKVVYHTSFYDPDTFLTFYDPDAERDYDSNDFNGFEIFREDPSYPSTKELTRPHNISFEYNDENYDAKFRIYNTAIIFAAPK